MRLTVEQFVEQILRLKIHVVSDRGWLRMCCPIHLETRPSFGILSVYPHTAKCFSCSYKDSLVGVTAKVLRVSRMRAFEIVNENVDIKLEAERAKPKVSQAVPDAVQDMYEACFAGSIAAKYAKFRGVPRWASKLWGLGFDELNTALVVPMRGTADGKIYGHFSIALQGTFDEVYRSKQCDEAGKTVTVPADFARHSYQDCVVTEGIFDGVKAAEALWKKGITAMPVVLNTAYPAKEQLGFIRRFKRVCLGLDHDAAGLRATEYCRKQLADKAFLYDFVYPENRKDPGMLEPGDDVSIKLSVK